MSEWKKIQLKDIVSILGDGLHGTPEYSEDGEYYFVNGNNLSDGHIVITQETKRISHNEYLKYKKELNEKTLLVSINGTLGNVAYYKGEKVILGKSTCYFNLLESVDKNFVRYVLSSDYFQKYAHTYANGTTIKNLSLKAMREFSFSLPPIKKQQEIAAVLICLDRKIENLRRQNETLERIAQTLFKHWFVDFEFPNETCKPYKSAGGEMVQSELGEIPAGWRIANLRELVTVTDYVANGSFASLKENVKTYDSENYALYVRLVDYNNQFSSNLKYVDKSSFEFLSKSQLKGSEIIVSNIGANAGTIFRPPAWLNKPMVLGSNSVVFYSEYFSEYVYYFLSGHQGKNVLQGIIGGSAQPKFNKTDFRSIELLKPDLLTIDNFNKLAIRLRDKFFVNNASIQTLAKTRDVLLPKLMSGKLRIPES